MKTVYIKYSPDARCKCGGVVFYDGTFKQNLPEGFGFAPGSTRFQVDSIRIKGHYGFCDACGSKVLAWTSRRRVKTFPRSINKKIKIRA